MGSCSTSSYEHTGYVGSAGPGDTVAVDDIIAQIETDKVTIDVRSPEAGVVEKLVVKVGDTVTPGTVVAIVTKGGAGAEATSAPTPPPAQEEAAEEEAAPLASEGGEAVTTLSLTSSDVTGIGPGIGMSSSCVQRLPCS